MTEPTEDEEEIRVISDYAEVTAEQIIAQELHKANMEPVTLQEQPEIEQPKATYTDKDSDKKEKSAIPYLIATIIIVLLLLNRQIGKKGRKKHEKKELSNLFTNGYNTTANRSTSQRQEKRKEEYSHDGNSNHWHPRSRHMGKATLENIISCHP